MLKIRAYFGAHPGQEVIGSGLTAANANIVATAITQAAYAEGQAETQRDEAARERDESFDRLRGRLVGLRAELEQLMDPDDMRWRTFGFARPVDRRIPKAVTGLILRPSGVPGEIIVQWNAAIGAENYRVTRQIETVDLEPVEVGMFSDRVAIISGLPVGKTVIVSLTARNPASETQAVNSSTVAA